MPIEIKELHIRINVSEGAGAAAATSSGSAASGGTDAVAECLEQVMDVIRKQKER